MLAFGLSLALFIFWGLAGYALLALLKIRRSAIQNLLLAPAVGVSVTLIPIFWLNRSGLPIAGFGALFGIALLLLSMGVIWFIRPIFPVKQYLPFGAILLVALFITGRPMLEFGFNWVSFSNDDMANYVLESMRVLDHGFFDIPNLEEFASGSNYSLAYWFFYLSADSLRTGVEMLIAWVCSLTGLLPIKTFMPVIMAFYLVLISSAGALVHQNRRLRSGAILSCVLLAFSAINSLGALYQLIAQVAGLGLLIGCMTVLLRPYPQLTRKTAMLNGILAALLVSALLITYPEVTPFLALAFILYWAIGLIRHQLLLRPLLQVLAISIPLVLITLGDYLLLFGRFVEVQVYKGFSQNSVISSFFPYFLIPGGLSYFWGFQGFTLPLGEPEQSIVILLGGMLLIFGSLAAGWQAWQMKPAAAMTLVMMGVGLRLFTNNNGFGLYKLAMYIQPFILATLVLAWLQLSSRMHKSWQLPPLILLVLSGLTTQFGYVQTSRGLVNATGGFTEIPGASQFQIFENFDDLIRSTDPSVVVSDTSNVSFAKLQTIHLIGRSSVFPSRDYFSSYTGGIPTYAWRNPEIPPAAAALRTSWDHKLVDGEFDMQDDDSSTPNNDFIIDDRQPPLVSEQGTYLIANATSLSLFNRSQYDSSEHDNFLAIPWAQVENHLIFISSQLGEHYYIPQNRHNVSFYQLERDYFFPESTMSGVGRNFLFQVINPTPGARLVLDITDSLKSDGKNELPPAIAIGGERRSFSVIGRGSARIVSPPIAPQMIRGRPYLMIDMGIDGVTFPNNKRGLMKLYGMDILLDPRDLVGFVRNISLISEQDYANMVPPSWVRNFPADLADPNLEYSGLYEDGWVAEAAYLNLTQPDAASPLVLRGLIPLIQDSTFSTELIVLVDGQEQTRKILKLGEFEVQLQVPFLPGKRRIDLRFSNMQALPGADRRPAAALIKFVGFETK